MTYVFFSDIDSWKSKNLNELKDFINRNYGLDVSWMELGEGEKLTFSECGKYSLESCKFNFKCLHQFATIGELKRLIHCQN